MLVTISGKYVIVLEVTLLIIEKKKSTIGTVFRLPTLNSRLKTTHSEPIHLSSQPFYEPYTGNIPAIS